MSGEAIVFTSTFSLVTAVHDSIVAYREERQNAIEQAIKERKLQLEQWQNFQLRQTQNIQELENSQAQLQDKLDKLQLIESKAVTTSSAAVKAKGFVASTEDYQEPIGELESLIQDCQSLPASLLTDNSPIKRLMAQANQYLQQYESNLAPSQASIVSFKQAVNLTVQEQLGDLQQHRLQGAKLLTQTEALLDEVIEYQFLALSIFAHIDSAEIAETAETAERNQSPDIQQLADLKQIEQHLLRVLEHQKIKLSDIQLLETKVKQIKQEIETQIADEMNHQDILQSIKSHLYHLGYQTTSPANDDRERVKNGESNWLIPGGEQLKIQLHADMRMAFQVQHESTDTEQSELDESELAFLRQQEKKWCDDLPKLLQKLAADGFEYQIDFQREIPHASIPIVVVDELDDLIAKEDEQATGKKQKRCLQ